MVVTIMPRMARVQKPRAAATIDAAGRIEWYRMSRAYSKLSVGMTPKAEPPPSGKSLSTKAKT